MFGKKGLGKPEPLNALDISDQPGLDRQTVEVLRLWVENGVNTHTFVDPTRMGDPELFGRAIAIAVQDSARAYGENFGDDGNITLNRIFQAMYKQLIGENAAADEARVRILDR